MLSASEKGLLVSCAAFVAGAGLGCVLLSLFQNGVWGVERVGYRESVVTFARGK